jgi:formyltetrahydrofolate-dependent phosphoribosylglycinamide formyltransferase
VAVFCSGRGSNMAALIEAARAADYPAEIALVISNKPDAPGLEIARELGVKAVAIASKPFGRDREAHERAIDAALAAENIQIVCLAGYMRLLTPFLVGRWRGRMLNIHPSLLPAYPGLDTHARVLAAGEKRHGCTVHLVTEVMDEGPILAQAEVDVLQGDTEEVLAARVLAQEHLIYPAALAEYVRANPLPGAGAKP